MKKLNFKWLLLSFILSIASITQVDAATRRYYCEMTQSWWTGSSASVGCYAWNNSENNGWPGTKMTSLGNGKWYIDLDTKYTKVVFTRLNSAGNEYWGAKTQDITLGAENYYTITNTEVCWTDGCTCSYTASKYATPNPAIVGTMNSWKPETNQFSGSSGSVTCSISLSANTVYEFKVLQVSTHYGYGSNTGDLTYVGQSGSTTLSSSGENIRLATAGAGTYVFTYNCTSHTLSVAYPSVTHPSSDYIYFKDDATPAWTVAGHIWGGSSSMGTVWGSNPALSSFTFNGGTYYYMATGDHTSALFGQGIDNDHKTADLTISGNKRKWYSRKNTNWNTFTVSITYKDQGGGDFSGSQTSPPTTHTYGSSTTLKIPTKTGYNFAGWFTASDCASGAVGTSSSASLSATGYTSDITLYAKWTAKQTTITLYLNGGTAGDEEVVATYDEELPEFTLATKTGGYNLTGYWTDDDSGDKIINADGSYAANGGVWNIEDATLDLYAQWNNFLSVTYDGNGNTGGSAPSDANEYASGDEVTVLAAPVGMVKTGYTFAGWKTGGTTYSAGDKFNITANTTLTAQWTENTTTVTISVNPSNSGALTVDDAAFSSGSTVSVGVTTHADVEATAYPGYYFNNWTKSGNATQESVSSNTYTVGGNGSSGIGTLTANFNRTYAYIQGRMTVYNAARSSETNTASSKGGWDESSTRIEMEVDATRHCLVRHTYKTPKELTDQISSNDQWFSIKTGTVHDSYASGTVTTYHPSANSTLSSTGKVNKVAAQTSTTTYNYKFNSSVTDGYVILCFDEDGVWYELERRLTYNANGGTGSAPSNNGNYFADGASATTGANAYTKSGYHFTGWKVNNAGDLITAGSSVTMNANVVLYAQWEENSFNTTLAFSPSGSKATTSPAKGTVSIKQVTGTEITATAATDSVFDHWTVSGGGLTMTSDAKVNPNTFKATSADGTITAYFEDQWCLKGDQWDSWSTSKGLPKTATNTYSASFTLTKDQKYQFKVHDRSTNTWYGNTDEGGEYAMERGASAFTTTAGGSNNNLTITPDVTGTYTFSFNTSTKALTVTFPTAYTVTYGAGTINGSDADITVSPSFTSGDYVLPETDITFSKGTTKDGYTWKGWYSDQAGSATKHSSTDGDFTWSDTRTSNISVYACYNFITYDITYNLNGGSNHASNPDEFNVETSTITLQNPTRTGYTFGGWYDNSSLTGDAVTTIAKGTHEDQEFWAKWTANDYTITLKPNGGSGDDQELTATFDATAPDYDDEAKNYKFASITNPTKTGYNFEGWWTSSDAGTTLVTEIITKFKFYEWNTSYVNNSGLWKNAGDVTAYAKWTPATYTVTLSQSTETGYGSAGANSSVTATYDAAMPTMGSAPVGATGYKFMGYFSEANGGGKQYYGADGTSINNWDVASATTLHAHFLKSEITGLEHDASIAKGEEVTIDVNPVINVTPEGYTAICWSLLYADTDNPVETSHYDVDAKAEVGKPMQVTYTLKNLENGSYKIKAIYKSNGSSFDACAAGTTQNTYYSTFRIIGSNTITLRYTNDKYYDPYFLRENGSIEIPAMESVGVKAPEIVGWTFWKWDYSDGIHSECANTGVCNWDKDSINISASYDGTLTAMYKKKQMIYFNNTLGWEDVYVYFYNDGGGNRYWADGYGSGANQKQEFNSNKPYNEGEHGHMTRIAGTNIWYFDFKAAGYNTTRTKVAFANVEQSINKSGASDDEAYFNNASVVYRTDFDASHLPMFVPINSVEYDYTTNTGSKYYRGYWMNYPDSTGYELRIYNKKERSYDTDPFELSYKRQIFNFTGDKTMPMSVTVDLEANRTYGFKIYRTDGTYWGNANTMTNGHSGDEGQAVWEFKTETSNAGLTTTGAGYYTFTLSYGEDVSSNFNYLVGVRYPESSGDFRVLYKDNDHTNWRPSAIIPLATDTTIVSYFVRKDQSPFIKAQKCSLDYEEGHDGEPEHMILSWEDENEGADLLPDTISENGVYNFYFTKDNGELVLSKVEPYTGNFYIRVDGAGYSNWDKYIADDHLMPYSDYSFNQATDKYSHYFTHYYDAPASESADRPNIKFVVANEYSPYISDTITRDGVADEYVDANGYICRDANIRFMYNYKTNEATRRYIDGAQESGSTFLVLIPSNDESIFDAETEGNAITPEDPLTFSDDGNWIYEANVWAVPGTKYKLRAKYGVAATGAFNENGEVISYLKGKETGDGEYEILIDGDGESREHLRLLYDFKTNRLVAAWLPSGTINADHAINADVMFIREGQEDVTQVTFGESGSISAIQNVYSVMRFNKWTLNNRDKSSHSLLGSPLSPYERALYWISFPYDVRLSDVFGFGTYGTHWIIEYYDGEYRAAHGYWADSEANWKFVMPNERNNFVLKAGLGYILALDLDQLHCESESEGYQADIWKNIQYGEIIFPGDIASIGNTSVTYNIPAHNCNITRNERNIKDSHWNVIGVPTYLNTSDVTYVDATEKQSWMIDGKPKYIYTWNPQDNSITSVSAAGLTYHSMTAYMVQYYGNITFTTSTVSLAAAPQRYENAPQDVEFRLEIQQNEETVDQTFVRMSIDEDVTAGFEFGQDMTKEMNAGKANVYTLIAGSESNIEAAGNVLPFSNQTTVVPVGVKIKTTGDYTFSIPEGTRGVGVTLVDTETGIRTSLSALDYTINLTAGTYDSRFVLEISPIVQSPTDIDAVSDQQSAVRKVMIDGILYIVKDGKVYDAQGKRVQ